MNDERNKTYPSLPQAGKKAEANDFSDQDANGATQRLMPIDVVQDADVNEKLSAKSIVSEILVIPGDMPYAGKDIYLQTEQGREVFYHGNYVTRIPLQDGPLVIGRRDVMAGHYPDIDLAMYWKQDRTLSRRHLRVYSDMNGNYFAEDICNNNATFLNDREHPLNKERAELKPGDRILVSQSIVFEFCVKSF